MRRFSGIFTFFALVLSANFALAATPYFSFQTGGTFLQDSEMTSDSSVFSVIGDYSAGYNFSAAAGIEMDYFRIDAEITYSDVNADKFKFNNDDGLGTAVGLGSLTGSTIPMDGSAETIAVMINGYIDFDNSTKLTPYLMFGIGGASIDLDVTSSGITLIDDSDISLVYKFGVGGSYKISNTMNLFMGYHYLTAEDLEFIHVRSGFFNAEYDTHNINFGIRVAF